MNTDAENGLQHADVPQPKHAHENPNLYEDDLTDERQPTPAQRDEVAQTESVDP